MENAVKWKSFITVLISSILLCGGAVRWAMDTHNAQPHPGAATKEQIKELREEYRAMVKLKNIDNQWYRELGEEVAGMKSDIAYIKDDVKEIKKFVLSRSQ